MATESKIASRYAGMRVTREQYLDLEEDGFAYEVVDGVMQLSPSPLFEHNDLLSGFLFAIRSFLREKPMGRAVVETDVLLPDGGDPLRPDLSFILKENMYIVQSHIHGAPDLVCEVISLSSRDRDLGEKADRYLKCGVKEYWILDPKNRLIALWINRQDGWEKKSGESLESELLPGFTVTREELDE
ncbi:MAG: Uma2 family endonuclease [Spirochaetales bacterium]|nr:Uma2 family endonuclease [Spirochaetales bacterium]